MSSTTAAAPIKCKGMVKYSKEGALVEEDIIVAPPKKGEVRVKIFSSGVCHTDYSEPRNFPSEKIPKGGDPAHPGFPMICGHESAGIVESVGDGVEDVKPGDHVVVLYLPECRKCDMCLSGGRSNHCSALEETGGITMLDGTTRLTLAKNGNEILHFMSTSTFAEYAVVHECQCAKISKEAPLDKVGLLGCGVGTGFFAVRTCGVTRGSTVAVFGLGGVGQAVVMGAKQMGASRIVGIDMNPKKEAIGRALGMTDFINPNALPDGASSPEGAVWDVIGGADFAFECVGNVKVMRAALDAAKWGTGTMCVIGVAPAGAELSFPPLQVVCGKRVMGVAFGGCRGRTELPAVVDSYMRGGFDLDAFCNVFLPHTEVNKAFEFMHDKESTVLRSIITFPHAGDKAVAEHRMQHKKGALVFLHGLGDEGASWQGAAEWLMSKVGAGKGHVIRCPNAPVMRITKNVEAKDDEVMMPAWFDVKKPWPATPSVEDDADGLKYSGKLIDKEIEKIITQSGIPAERIILCGFSQGAVLSLSYAASSKHKLGGVICLSGWVPNRSSFSLGKNAETPILWGHGAKDEIVSVECQKVGVEALKAQKANVEAHTYAELGHDTNEEEFETHVLGFLKAVLEK